MGKGGEHQHPKSRSGSCVLEGCWSPGGVWERARRMLEEASGWRRWMENMEEGLVLR